jgi:hypothetical protein
MTTTAQQENQAHHTSATQPMVTLVVVPRERFSYAEQSLESIYENTNDYPLSKQGPS